MTVSVVIGIATYRRPLMLRNLLRALEKQNSDATITVLVVDNDVTLLDGIETVREVSNEGYRFPLKSAIANVRGISSARNEIINRGFEDRATSFIAFVDDDQEPDSAWLSSLLEEQRKTGADIVGCTVLPKFQVPPPKWVEKSRLYLREVSPNYRFELSIGTGGTLVSRSILKIMKPPWFSEEFAVTGGEDADFFIRVRKSGGSFSLSSQAKIHENYPESRLRLRWALSRAYRTGEVQTRLERKYNAKISRLALLIIKAMAAIVLAVVELLIFPMSTGRRINALVRFARGVGKIGGLIGLRYNEYAAIY